MGGGQGAQTLVFFICLGKGVGNGKLEEGAGSQDAWVCWEGSGLW